MKHVRLAVIAMSLLGGAFWGTLVYAIFQNKTYGFATFAVTTVLSLLIYCVTFSDR